MGVGDQPSGLTMRSKHIASVQCCMCVHLRSIVDRRCDAYPDGVPDPIWDDKTMHTVPIDGDHGIRYQERAVRARPMTAEEQMWYQRVLRSR